MSVRGILAGGPGAGSSPVVMRRLLAFLPGPGVGWMVGVASGNGREGEAAVSSGGGEGWRTDAIAQSWRALATIEAR